ncbi:MAG: 6-phosphogluconolactonase [Chloroflexota bacterium]
MTAAEIVVVADPDAAADVAAARIAAILSGAVATRGRADWATTGGSTAPGIYRRLAAPPLRDEVPWAAVHVWWGDDRFVPRDHPLSNVKPLDDILVPDVPLPQANLHPFRSGEAIGAGRDAASVARLLAAELADAAPTVRDGFPVLDLVVLGVGADGHILSVFPGSAIFNRSDRLDRVDWAADVPAPTHIEPHVPRVTMDPAVVRVARQVLVVATGAGKARILADVFGDIHDAPRWPAQLALGANATWILDEGAAAGISR